MFTKIISAIYFEPPFWFSTPLKCKPFHLFLYITEITVGNMLVSGVATVEWTYVAIYHLSLSTCVGGPTTGVIAIWEQLTVIPFFCLCESPISSASLIPDFLLVVWRGLLGVNHYALSETKHKWILAYAEIAFLWCAVWLVLWQIHKHML